MAAAEAEARAIFGTIDADNDGSLSMDEMRDRLCDFGMDDQQIEQLFFALDTDSDGAVSRAEFIAGFGQFMACVQRAGGPAAPGAFALAASQLRNALVRNTSSIPRQPSAFASPADAGLWRTRTGSALDLPVGVVDDGGAADAAAHPVLLLSFQAFTYMGLQTSDSSALSAALKQQVTEPQREMFQGLFDGCGEIAAVALLNPVRRPELHFCWLDDF